MLVIGAGSAGARHARNLAEAGAAVWVTDPDEQRASGVAAAHPLPFRLDELGSFDGIVVASPSASHLEHLEWALGRGARVLVEKPLAVSAVGLEPVMAGRASHVMVGYNLRLHQPLRRLVSLVQDGRAGRVTSVRAWFGSYLPDWRPKVDYRRTYSARAALGGGVLLDAIHELDVLVWLLGDGFEVVGAAVERLGSLDIDVEDTVKAVLRHATGALVEVSLDYLSRRYRRGVEVVGDQATIRLDWARDVLEVEDAGTLVAEAASEPVSRSYERQAAVFLSWLRDEARPPVDGWEGAASLRLADGIRKASR